jgi:hypothetical protein
MNRSRRRWLAEVAFAALPMLAPGAALAASSTGALLDYLTDDGQPVSVGLGVSPLRPQLTVPAPAVGNDSRRVVDLEARHGTALSLDLRLRWPGAETIPLEPYLTLGPALFVGEPDDSERALGSRVDPGLRIGAKAGAGVNWRLGKTATLFGAYELTTTGDEASGVKHGADPGPAGYDFTYGLRFRF